MGISGRQYELNGIRLNVYVEGEGEPVLLLHGFPDSNHLCGPLEHWFDQAWRQREIELVKWRLKKKVPPRNDGVRMGWGREIG